MTYVDPSGYEGIEVLVPSRRTTEQIPGNAFGFDAWYDGTTASDMRYFYDSGYQDVISDRLRGNGGMHEWFMVSQAPLTKEWGVSAETIKIATTPTAQLEFININTKKYGVQNEHHGNANGSVEASVSTSAHNEIKKLMQSSNSETEFKEKIRAWADDHVRVTLDDGTVLTGRDALPDYFKEDNDEKTTASDKCKGGK